MASPPQINPPCQAQALNPHCDLENFPSFIPSESTMDLAASRPRHPRACPPLDLEAPTAMWCWKTAVLQRRLWKNFRSSNDSPLPGSRGTFCENGAFRDRWKHEILVELHIPDASLDHKSASVVSLKFPGSHIWMKHGDYTTLQANARMQYDKQETATHNISVHFSSACQFPCPWFFLFF